MPAISLGGIIECMIVEGSFNSDLFLIFIRNVLNRMQPFPGPNSVIVMDNCAIHKVPEVRELIEARYAIGKRSILYAHQFAGESGSNTFQRTRLISTP